MLTALALAIVGILMPLGVAYWIGWVIACALLAYENSIVRPDDLSRINLAFFNVNGYISVITFVATWLGLYI